MGAVACLRTASPIVGACREIGIGNCPRAAEEAPTNLNDGSGSDQMRALLARLRKARPWARHEYECRGAWFSAAFWVPLPAVTFAWWVLIVRPVWMPVPEVRQALLVTYVVVAVPLCLVGFLYRASVPEEATSLIALASALLCGASVFIYPSAGGVYLASLGTVAGAIAVALAVRGLVRALKPIRDRKTRTYFLIVMPTILVVVVAESALWPWQRFDLWRLIVVGLCAIAVAFGIALWRCRRAPLISFLAITTSGLFLAVAAEGFQFASGAERSADAALLQHLGARFLAYWGAGMSLILLPEMGRDEARVPIAGAP